MSFPNETGRKRRAPSPVSDEPGKKTRIEETGSTTATPSLMHMSINSSSNILTSSLSMASPTGYSSTGRKMVPSPFGLSYQYNACGNTNSRPQVRRCGLKIGNIAFEDAKLSIPQEGSAEQQESIKLKWQNELQRQEENPPALPRSQVPDLPPKSTLIEFHNVPDDATEEEKERIRLTNRVLAQESQRIDRERNNQAAKKSRETRLEALHNTRVMLNDKAAECDWLRLKLIQLGGDTSDWDTMDGFVKSRIVEKIAERVTACDQIIAEEKKREEQRKRAERTKARMQVRDATSASPALQNMMSPLIQRGEYSYHGFQ